MYGRHEDWDNFGIDPDEAETLMDHLKRLDAEHKDGALYPECPRCEGSRVVEAIVRMGMRPETESFNCPLCGGTGEADIERAEEWVLERMEQYEYDEEDEKYVEGREKIS